MNDEQMFEKELRQYCPAEPSLRLQQAIAVELDPAPLRQAVRRRRVLWLVGCAAACLVLGVSLALRQPGGTGPLPAKNEASGPLTAEPGVKPLMFQPDRREHAAIARLTPQQVKALPPTEWGYELAAQSSPEDKVLFLEHQANVVLPDVEKRRIMITCLNPWRRKMKTTLTITLLFTLAGMASAAPPVAPAAGPKAAENAATVYWQAFAALPDMSSEAWDQARRRLLEPLDAPLDQADVVGMLQAASPRCSNYGGRPRPSGPLDDRSPGRVRRPAGASVQGPPAGGTCHGQRPAEIFARPIGRGCSRSDRCPAPGQAPRRDPYFLALNEQLYIEGLVFRAAAANLKEMDAAAMKILLAGLDAAPHGGSMAAIMADGRQSAAGLVKDLENARVIEVSPLVEKRFGKLTAEALSGTPKERLLAGLKSLLALADRCADAMQIPDNRIADFEQQRVKLAQEWGKIMKAHPELPGVVVTCCDVTDRYLEGRVHVLQPMLRAAIAYRQGGKAAFEKVRDPYSDGPFELRLSDGKAVLASRLCVGTTIIEQTFTLPKQ